MNDLVIWLRVQLDDDTAEIDKHPDGADDWAPSSLYATAEQNYPGDPYLGISKQRAIAEVDAKRRILDELWDHDAGLATEHTAPRTAHAVLRLLALPYADRTGYRDEWRPEP